VVITISLTGYTCCIVSLDRFDIAQQPATDSELTESTTFDNPKGNDSHSFLKSRQFFFLSSLNVMVTSANLERVHQN
jgi:hypothetical protein